MKADKIQYSESKLDSLNGNFKRRIKFRFASDRSEKMAWILFFGVGVAYFVATLMISL